MVLFLKCKRKCPLLTPIALLKVSPLCFGFRSSYIFDTYAANEKLVIETRVGHIKICNLYNWYFF